MYISYWSIKDHIWTWECTVARWRISSWWLLTRRVPDRRLRGRNCTGCSFGRTSCRIASRGYACGDDLRCCGWGEAWRDVWCHWEFVHVGRSTVRTVWWVYVGPFICFWLRRVQEQTKQGNFFKWENEWWWCTFACIWTSWSNTWLVACFYINRLCLL